MSAKSNKLRSPYDLEDTCYKTYCGNLNAGDARALAGEALENLHLTCKNEAIEAFDRHPRLRSFKTKIVQAARDSLIYRIEMEVKRVRELGEEERATAAMTAHLLQLRTEDVRGPVVQQQEHREQPAEVVEQRREPLAAPESRALDQEKRLTETEQRRDPATESRAQLQEKRLTEAEQLRAKLDKLMQEGDRADGGDQSDLEQQIREEIAKIESHNATMMRVKPTYKEKSSSNKRSFVHSWCYCYYPGERDETDVPYQPAQPQDIPPDKRETLIVSEKENTKPAKKTSTFYENEAFSSVTDLKEENTMETQQPPSNSSDVITGPQNGEQSKKSARQIPKPSFIRRDKARSSSDDSVHGLEKRLSSGTGRLSFIDSESRNREQGIVQRRPKSEILGSSKLSLSRKESKQKRASELVSTPTGSLTRDGGKKIKNRSKSADLATQLRDKIAHLSHDTNTTPVIQNGIHTASNMDADTVHPHELARSPTTETENLEIVEEIKLLHTEIHSPLSPEIKEAKSLNIFRSTSDMHLTTENEDTEVEPQTDDKSDSDSSQSSSDREKKLSRSTAINSLNEITMNGDALPHENHQGGKPEENTNTQDVTPDTSDLDSQDDFTVQTPRVVVPTLSIAIAKVASSEILLDHTTTLSPGFLQSSTVTHIEKTETKENRKSTSNLDDVVAMVSNLYKKDTTSHSTPTMRSLSREGIQAPREGFQTPREGIQAPRVSSESPGGTERRRIVLPPTVLTVERPQVPQGGTVDLRRPSTDDEVFINNREEAIIMSRSSVLI